MGFFSKIADAFTGSDDDHVRVLPSGGRVSVESSGKLPFMLRVKEGRDGNKTQQYIEMNLKSISKMPVAEIYKTLVDSDAEVSLALYHFQRFCNAGYSIEVFQPGSEITNQQGKEVIERFERLLEDLYGGFDVLLSRIFYSIFIGGAIFCEILLDNDNRDMIDFIVVNPHEARYRKSIDPDRGEYWELGQIQDGDFVSLHEYDTVTYMPFDPAVGSPYGRAIISPTVFSTLFLVSILRDLERVIRHQGWQRLDIVLNTTEMDFGTADDAGKKAIIDEQINSIISQYKKLEPDDVFVHTNQFEFGTPVGSVGRFGMQGVDDIIRTLERRIFRALKSQPLLMGSNETATETHANRQWEIYVASIRSVQSIVERSVSNLLRIGLEAQGILADVNITFNELRDSERMRYAQADQIELTNLKLREDQEWIDKDEARERSELIGA